MLPITFPLDEVARLRLCILLLALTFLGIGLSTLHLVAVRLLSSSFADYTSLVDGYDGELVTTVLTYLASAAILVDVLGLCVAYTAMYPERRAESRLRTFAVTLAQLCLVVAFAWSCYICYDYADRVNYSFKVRYDLIRRDSRSSVMLAFHGVDADSTPTHPTRLYILTSDTRDFLARKSVSVPHSTTPTRTPVGQKADALISHFQGRF